ncbi:MAG TPA: PQQ-binding-like beta-propeller repeat protein, partial [Thermoanaerobaculia bacterium]|nr:PQQ-binding-like beta-propeller repeat protein [Thermoanaerobaculia bacterium]
MSRHRANLSLAFLLLLCVTLLAPPSSRATDWPVYRGTDQDGKELGPGLLPAGPMTLEARWKRALGSGYSGIVAAGGTGVTMYTDGKDDLLAAFDLATGAEKWRLPVAPMYAGHDGSDNGPLSTPAIAGGVVFALSPKGRLLAVQLADGNPLWSRNLNLESEAKEPTYGFATSPLPVGEAVVVVTGKDGGRTLTAFRATDGQPLWNRGDDTASYQSPLYTKLAGRDQLVVVGERMLFGLDPGTGEQLWQHAFLPAKAPFEGFTQPVALGDNRLFINNQEVALAVEVKKGATGFEVKELWRGNSLQGNLVVPVYHDGHLYGFSGRFLTCVEAATGKTVWKSRPPGGRGLILVDGHLAILAPSGELVLAEASPAGYVEKARVPVLARDGSTAPSFAGGSFLVRNLEELASVTVRAATTATASAVRKEELPVSGQLASFVARLTAAPAAERKGLVDALLAEHKSLPWIEPGGTVHFLYRGATQDVSVTGNVAGFTGDELPLVQLAGTDLWGRSVELDAEGQWEYSLTVDFGDPVPDPANPLRVGTEQGEVSELRGPRWPAPSHLTEPPAARRGRIDTFSFKSAIRGDEREVKVYLPVGYDAGSERYPLLVLNYGLDALRFGQIDRALDNLIGEKVRPLVVALLPRLRGEYNGPNAPDYIRLVVEELVPHLEKTYRLASGVSNRGIGGVGSGAFSALSIALRNPGTFGRVSLQSFYMPPALAEELIGLARERGKGLERVFLEISRHDYQIAGANIDAIADSRRLLDTLKTAGANVT